MCMHQYSKSVETSKQSEREVVLLIAVQVSYWDYQERKRHNIVSEGLEQQKIDVERGKLEETTRHNVETENISWFHEQEVQRHNSQQESYWFQSLAETTRHNQQQEVYWFNSLAETARHNRASESIGWAQAQAAQVQAAAAQSQAATARTNAQINYVNALHNINKVKAETALTDQKRLTEVNQGTKNYWDAQRSKKDVDWYTFNSISKPVTSTTKVFSTRGGKK